MSQYLEKFKEMNTFLEANVPTTDDNRIDIDQIIKKLSPIFSKEMVNVKIFFLYEKTGRPLLKNDFIKQFSIQEIAKNTTYLVVLASVIANLARSYPTVIVSQLLPHVSTTLFNSKDKMKLDSFLHSRRSVNRTSSTMGKKKIRRTRGGSLLPTPNLLYYKISIPIMFYLSFLLPKNKNNISDITIKVSKKPCDAIPTSHLNVSDIKQLIIDKFSRFSILTIYRVKSVQDILTRVCQLEGEKANKELVKSLPLPDSDSESSESSLV